MTSSGGASALALTDVAHLRALVGALEDVGDAAVLLRQLEAVQKAQLRPPGRFNSAANRDTHRLALGESLGARISVVPLEVPVTKDGLEVRALPL